MSSVFHILIVSRGNKAQKKRRQRQLSQTDYRPVSLLRCAFTHFTADSALGPTDLCLHSQQMYYSRDNRTNQVKFSFTNVVCTLLPLFNNTHHFNSHLYLCSRQVQEKAKQGRLKPLYVVVILFIKAYNTPGNSGRYIRWNLP